MRSFNWKTVSTLVTMMAVAGCQESVSAPQVSSTAPAAMMLAPAGSPQLSLTGKAQADGDVDFTVTPNGGTFLLGNHAIVFPARSICDPAVSSYGAGKWGDACVALKGAIRIHATIRTAQLGTWVDFSPSLRFVPSAEVYLVMYTPNVIGATDLSKYSILWTPGIGKAGVAENNPALKTYVNTQTGISMRRIEHFTGYLTSSGQKCDPAVNPDCLPVP